MTSYTMIGGASCLLNIWMGDKVTVVAIVPVGTCGDKVNDMEGASRPIA